MEWFNDTFIFATFFFLDNIIFALPVFKFRFSPLKTVLILLVTLVCTLSLFPNTPVWQFISGGQGESLLNALIIIIPPIIGFCIVSDHNIFSSLYIYSERHNIGFATNILRTILSMLTPLNVWMCAAISYILVIPVLIYLIKTRKKSLNFFTWMNIQRKPFFLLPLLITIILRLLMVIASSGNVWSYVIIFGLILLSALVYYFMNYTAEQSMEAVKLQSVNSQVEFQRERISHYETLQDTIKRQQHDLRHHNTLILGYLQKGKVSDAVNYLEQLQAEIESDEFFSYCDNYILNLLISVYALRAKKKNIKVYVSIRGVADLKVEDSDLSVIVSNLVENAFEACLRLPESDERFIKIFCSHEDGRLQISVENSCRDDIEFDKHDMPLTKKKNGGIGTKSVRHIVKKYDGFISFSIENNRFLARVVISD